MVQIENLAEAALQGDALLTRSLAQDFCREHARLSEVPAPATADTRVLITSAALLELLALYLQQDAPAWTKSIGRLAEPIFLVKAAEYMKRLRALCEAESPEPLRKRGLYAPPGYLALV